MIRVVVVDTNVPIAASGDSKKSGQASPDCVLACNHAIREVTERRVRLALDDDWQIITEYRRNLATPGQTALSDEFLIWVLTNKDNLDCCDLVPLTSNSRHSSNFEEFPKVAGLEDFDPSDMKFVAVANAHPEKPPILQALDSKWWGWKEALASAGITVEFLCPAEVKETHERKVRNRHWPAKKASRG